MTDHFHPKALRGLMCIALATAIGTLACVDRAPAQDRDARSFEAIAMPRSSAFRAVAPAPGPSMGCATVAYGTGDDGCGSFTGGPSGGNDSRN